MIDDRALAQARSVETTISYLAPGSFINRRFVAPGREVNTGSYEPHRVLVRDARPFAACFTLDEHGFQLFEHHSAIANFLDREQVDALYPEEVIALIRQLTGASVVVPQGWMIRTSGELAQQQQKVIGYQHRGGVQPPAGEAHIDFTPEYAQTMADAMYRKHFPDGKPWHRFLATSLWRCFSPPPQDWPLALCDARSVGADEGVPNRLVVVDEIPDGDGMLAEIPGEAELPAAAIFRYDPAHRWWYFSGMHRDEVVLLKFHDSDPARARRTPHTAFHDPSFADATTRQSIEFRSVAYFS